MTTVTSTTVVVAAETFTEAERLALAGFLAGYSGLTRDAYALDLRQFAAMVRRTTGSTCSRPAGQTSSAFGRDLEARGRARATVCAPAVHRRRLLPLRGRGRAARALARRCTCAGRGSTTSPTPPGSTATRSERFSSPPGSARLPSTPSSPCSPSTGCGSRKPPGPTSRRSAWSEDTGPSPSCAREERSSPSRSRRARRGRSTSPSANAARDRSSSVPTVTASTVTAPDGSCGASPAGPGSQSPSVPHTLRHAFITAALDAGVPLRDVQEAASHADPRTTMRYDRARVSLDRHATYIVSAFIAGAAR